MQRSLHSGTIMTSDPKDSLLHCTKQSGDDRGNSTASAHIAVSSKALLYLYEVTLVIHHSVFNYVLSYASFICFSFCVVGLKGRVHTVDTVFLWLQ